LKILFVGPELVAQHFTAALGQEDITVVRDGDLQAILNSIGRNEPDLAIVDSSLPAAELVCKRIGDLEIMPVVMIVNQSLESWTRLQPVCADAFITESATNPEILARIRAIYRRSKKTSFVVQR
jgi:DNA-binding response OmpR family regulator